MTVGMTLGKYAPLHRGHQHVIETALAETDHVIVIIYNATDVTSTPLSVRAHWIRTLYPQVEVLEAPDGPTEVSSDPTITRKHDEYLVQLLKDRNISRFYSSEFYGAHVSRALGAMDRRVDSSRATVPISGSQIREEPFIHRQYLDPVVYWDLVIKIVFLGAPSTGKTTLARQMAEEFDTVWMPEYGREYWEKNQIDRRLSQAQLLEIAEGHREREQSLIHSADRYMFIDSDATTTYNFSRYYHDSVHDELARLASKTSSRYDLFFVCDTDIPYDDSWDRSGEVHRGEFQVQTLADLTARQIPFEVLSGNLEQRVHKVKTQLLGFDKWL